MSPAEGARTICAVCVAPRGQAQTMRTRLDRTREITAKPRRTLLGEAGTDAASAASQRELRLAEKVNAMFDEKPKVVVVGVDFSSSGDDALLAGLRALSDGRPSELHLVHVLDPRDVVDEYDKPALLTEADVLEQAPASLLARADQLALMHGLRDAMPRVRTHTRIGRAVETLLQFTVDYAADLLIVGTHGRRGLERLMLGSVAEELVRRARCPVLVARPINYAGLEKTPLPDAPYAPGTEPPRRNPSIERVYSTEYDGWHPSDNGPTGIRIV